MKQGTREARQGMSGAGMAPRIRLVMIQPENSAIKRFRRMQLNNFSQITIPYLAAFVPEEHYEITLVDEYSRCVPPGRGFDLAAITVSTPNAPHCYSLASRLRREGVKVAFGGPHATLMPAEAAAYCDYLLPGECEETWPEFLKDFREGKARPLYEASRVPPLEGLPRPRWDLVKRSGLMKGAVFSSRGCPHACSYCNLKQIYHDSFRVRPVREVAQEVAAIGSRHFVFWDDNFFADRVRARLLMEAIAPLGKKWAAQVTLAGCDDAGLLALARKAGCMYLFVGLESFSAASLADAGKPVNRPRDYARIAGMIHEAGIMIQAGIVFGFDSDGRDVFEKTLEECEKIGIDGATVSVLAPFPGTPVRAGLESQGRLLEADWSACDSKTAVCFRPALMSPEELFEGYSRFCARFFSLKSFARRMRVSRTNVPVSLVMNLGYRFAARRNLRKSRKGKH